MTENTRSCPDCGERLAFDARQCACGWGAPRPGKHSGPRFDSRCTFKSIGARCAFPCAMFPNGATSGWCIFHRQPLQPGEAAAIVRESQTRDYLEALQPIIDAHKHAAAAVQLREAIAKRSGKAADHSMETATKQAMEEADRLNKHTPSRASHARAGT